jgi:hypothetical protein
MCSLPSPEHDYLLVYKPPNRFIPLPLTNDHARGRPFRLARVSRFSNLSTSRIVNKASHSSTPRERTSRDPPRVAGSSRHRPLQIIPGFGDTPLTSRPRPFQVVRSFTSLPASALERGSLRPFYCPGTLPHAYTENGPRDGPALTAYLSLKVSSQPQSWRMLSHSDPQPSGA